MNKPVFKKTSPGDDLCVCWKGKWLDVVKTTSKRWRVYYAGEIIVGKPFKSRWLAARWLIQHALEQDE